MDPELKDTLRKIAEGTHPERNWPISANHVKHVSYVGIVERRSDVRSLVIHPPRVGEHIRWMRFSKDALTTRITYYEVVAVQWDVRDNYQYLYRPGEEGEGYLTVFVRPMKNSPGEAFDRAQRAEERARQKRRRVRPRRAPNRPARRDGGMSAATGPLSCRGGGADRREGRGDGIAVRSRARAGSRPESSRSAFGAADGEHVGGSGCVRAAVRRGALAREGGAAAP